jgi:putative MATE family efflux protein
MRSVQRLAEEKIWKLLWQFTLPAMLVLLAGALYNVIDRIFIGNSMGTLGIAGITIAFPIMLVTSAVSGLIGTGAAALVSIRLGQKDQDAAEVVVGNALSLMVSASIVITILALIFVDPLLVLFGASPEVLPYAKTYLTIILLGTVFQTLAFGMNIFIRAEGNPRKAMVTVLTGPVLNAILAPIFLFGFGWGMAGAALATILAQIASATWVLSHFFSGKSILKIHVKNLKLQSSIVWKILAIGASPFLMQILTSLSNILVNTGAERYGGDLAVSGIGVLVSIQVLISLALMGISQGIQPILGFNFGAKKFDRIRETLVYALVVATVIATVVWGVTQLFPAQIVSLFNSQDQKLVEFSSAAMKVYLFALPVIGVQVIAAGYFQSTGKARSAMIITLSRQGLIYVPLLLILPLFFGLQGVIIAAPIANIAAFLLAGIWLLVDVRRLTGKVPEVQAVPGIVGKNVEGK